MQQSAAQVWTGSTGRYQKGRVVAPGETFTVTHNAVRLKLAARQLPEKPKGHKATLGKMLQIIKEGKRKRFLVKSSEMLTHHQVNPNVSALTSPGILELFEQSMSVHACLCGCLPVWTTPQAVCDGCTSMSSGACVCACVRV